MSSGSLAQIPVADEELLARFVLTKRHITRDGVVLKAEALLPYKWVELSVSRHRGLDEAELWTLGQEVARERSKSEAREIPLLGRADFGARTARRQKLDVLPAEPPRNHANVVAWPEEKSAQMSLAQELAAKSRFVPR